jgi:hypothetical protein
LERVLNPDALNALYERATVTQYTRDLLFSRGATRRPRPLRGEWHAEIRVVGGIS